MPKFSIIICTFNPRLEIFTRCLEALEHQTISDYELIICDDGTSSYCMDITELWRGSQPIYYVWQQNRGYRLAASRNNGARLARGSRLVFLDDHILVSPDHLKSLNKPGVGLSYINWTFAPLPKISGPEWFELCLKLPRSGDYRDFNAVFPGLLGGSFAIDRDMFWSISGFCEEFVGWGGEDNDFGDRLTDIEATFYRGEQVFHFNHEQSDAALCQDGSAVYRYRYKQRIAAILEKQLGRDKSSSHTNNE